MQAPYATNYSTNQNYNVLKEVQGTLLKNLNLGVICFIC